MTREPGRAQQPCRKCQKKVTAIRRQLRSDPAAVAEPWWCSLPHGECLFGTDYQAGTVGGYPAAVRAALAELTAS